MAPAAAAEGVSPDPWVSVTPEGYHRFTVPQAEVEQIVGSRPAVMELQGNIGPSGTWSDLAMDPSGTDYPTQVGILEPGLYYYQYTATFEDRTKKSFRNPSTEVAVTSHPTWNTFFVPGPQVQWMSDVANGGDVAELAYDSPVADDERTTLVWTPPGYDAERADAYPVLYLLADGTQSAQEWAELGRAPQVLDNLAAEGRLADMVVVMADVRGADPRTELLDGVVAAARDAYNVADDAAGQAVAGIGDGAHHALTVLRTDPGVFGEVGSFSGRLTGSISATTAREINEGTDRLRVYVGNVLDPAYNQTHDLLRTLERAGVDHEFDGVDPDSGGTWDTWREGLRDFASRVFQDDAGHGPREGHRPLDEKYTPPATGSITTPHVDDDGIVTFETGTQFADAKDVTVWANWAPNGAWFRVPMTKVGDRWRLSMGPLDGFYYYRYVVDGVDVKDPEDKVNTLTGVSPLFVPGETDRMLADVPADERGEVSVLTYDSKVANEERKAYVWTPKGYDPNRAEPYPVLYLNHGGGQNYGDWVEVGRAPQILDNYMRDGAIVPMVVVMGNGNSPDFPAELMENLAPAARAQYNIADDAAGQAIAGLSMGAMNTLNTWLTRPGQFGWMGAFSGGLFFNTPQFDPAAVNAETRLARVYTGDKTDFTYQATMDLLNLLETNGIHHEFAGVTQGPHGFDVWSKNLVDLLPRLFRDPQTTQGVELRAVVPEGEDGVLALSVADDGSGVTLDGPQNTGTALRFRGQLPTVTVTDSRSVTQAGVTGWAVTGQAYSFDSGSRLLDAKHLGWTPRIETPRAGLVAGDARATALDGGEGLVVPGRLASATPEGRVGSATIGADLVLDVPVDTRPGEYTGTLSLSLFPVD
ncbi:alpha/beta hydrolase-fold protein [Cellulomonas xiejunii]|uniref:alpha/beta hydrolase-fold protein n=1 Tax=Cellulomonas xiejunii TaxID=2968083 RepID=UPI001D0E36AB|nr:alpha/beta hydrolase-fold protein [Cellulomonas xiejunii]MCC2321407.1 esterase [Cellulomonas xiejunii]MCC2323441.1 esterase [Cellulomonas xiejunii]